MKLTVIMRTIHRVGGVLLSLLFSVWFLSGFVMIYHTFPRIGAADRLARKEALALPLPSLPEVLAQVPDSPAIRAITLHRYLGQTVFRIRTGVQEYAVEAGTLRVIPPDTVPHPGEVAALWCSAAVARIDTLYSLEQWIPFNALRKEFPIYKFYFSDEAKHQLYVSSRTGAALQFTDARSRFWAWLGAIPHWVYFTWLRQDADTWGWTVIVLAAIGCLVTLAGFYRGIRTFRMAVRRGKPFVSPYRKRWFRWHYVTGMVFGVFVLTWTFSGLMSLASIPKWFSSARTEYDVRGILRGNTVVPEAYRLDYRELAAAYPGLKEIEWGSFNGTPLYRVRTGGGEYTVDASVATVTPLCLTEKQVTDAVRHIHGEDMPLRTEWLTGFDTYYVSRKHALPLPVYRIAVADEAASTYYIDPASGAYRYVNRDVRYRHWMYPALHSFNIPWLVNCPVAWNSAMWGLMLGGTAVCLTSLALAAGYVKRKVRRAKKR
ncbi:MAG: PepSY domain-containing protein [Parabacteroides sp.]|nr:PepSY domain-containing protein [Parabacteroides sp.]